MKDTIKLNCDPKPLMVAHRGLSGIERENTHAAFIAAGNRSYYGIETDIYRTLDGRFVCMHDGDTRRVAIDKLVIEETTFDTLRALKLCGMSGKKDRADICIPTLEEYIAICRRYDKVPVCELKSAFTKDELIDICRIVADEGWLHKTVFISFNLQNLIHIRQYLPKQPLQFLTGASDKIRDILNEYDLDLDIYYRDLTKELCDAVHSDGHKINAWTVDSAEECEALARMGVDLITSNIVE